MHILFVIFSLSAGGAERVASTLINYWVGISYRVTLVTLDCAGNDFYPLDHRVQRVGLGLNQASGDWLEFIVNNTRRIRILRTTIRSYSPDVIVSFLDTTNVLVLSAAIGLGVPVVVSERIDPRKRPIGTIVRGLRRLLYKNARAVVVQTEDVAHWARRIVRSRAVYVIPNPVQIPPRKHDTERSTDGVHTSLAIGRMDVQKGFDLLLAAFAQCAAKHDDWNLRIIGEGAERDRLQDLADRLGISHRVRLDPVIREPTSAFMGADLFILSSRYEGFPNVLLEAMAFGLPVISFDCPSGPGEIIRDGVDGLLVPPNDIGALANAMDWLMGAERERRQLATRATEVTERFSLARIADMWCHVLEEAVS